MKDVAILLKTCLANAEDPDDMRLNGALDEADIARSLRTAIEVLDPATGHQIIGAVSYDHCGNRATLDFATGNLTLFNGTPYGLSNHYRDEDLMQIMLRNAGDGEAKFAVCEMYFKMGGNARLEPLWNDGFIGDR